MSESGLYRSFSPTERRRRGKRPRLAVTVILILLALGSAAAWKHGRRLPASVAQPGPTASVARMASVAQSQKIRADQAAAITKAIQGILSQHTDLSFGIRLSDLAGGQGVDINGATGFTAASTTKLITACLFLSQVEAGTHSLDESLGSFTASEQLMQLVNQSNNDSWDLFNVMLPLSEQEAYAKGIGLASYDSSANTVDPDDMAHLLSRLWAGTLLNPDDTDHLLSLMQNTNDESLIPAGLPTGTTVYHKYGELDDAVNDVAIIKQGNYAYVLAIFSSGNGYQDYDGRGQVFHDIEKSVTGILSGKAATS